MERVLYGIILSPGTVKFGVERIKGPNQMARKKFTLFWVHVSYEQFICVRQDCYKRKAVFLTTLKGNGDCKIISSDKFTSIKNKWELPKFQDRFGNCL